MQYTHIQEFPSRLWTITHNLDGHPIFRFQKYDNGNASTVYPVRLIFNSLQSLTAIFDEPIVGIGITI